MQTMTDRIEAHGRDLLAVFPRAKPADPVKLCKALRRVETAASRDAERYCNGEMDSDAWSDIAVAHLKRAQAILGIEPGSTVPMFVNGDARGHALKIDDAWARTHAPGLHRDWGGYAIVAPDLSGGEA